MTDCHDLHCGPRGLRWSRARTAGALALVACLIFRGTAAGGVPARLPQSSPEDAGMDGGQLARIDTAVAEAIAAGEMPGCVVCIGRGGKVVFWKAYGDRQIEPERIPMTIDTVFDLASLTKPIATATSVMILAERGMLRLDEPVAKHLPEFAQNGKGQVTPFHLLTHQGGLIPDNPLADYADGPQKAWERIFALPLRSEPGEQFVYTDVGFLVLGELVERVSGQTLDQFSSENIFRGASPPGCRDRAA
jgi:CubicO group peptidase (beta-lactamase class C family)